MQPGGLLWRLLRIEPGELGSLLWSCAYFFCLLAAYYVLRPVRDAMGVAGGVDNLKYLYLGTLSTMLLASLLFAAITTRFPRGRFIPYAYLFFIGNLLIFFAALALVGDRGQVLVGRVFYVWVSVFNLFVVSVFWSFMADIFSNTQGRRLFGTIAVGGSLGQMCGALVSGSLVGHVGSAGLLPVSMLLLAAACGCVVRLNVLRRRSDAGATSSGAEAPIGGSALSGLKRILQSPYLAGIALFILCYTVSSTFLYVTKLEIATQQSTSRAAHVAFFANIDFWTGAVTVAAQVFLTSRVIARFGIGVTLGLLPMVTIIGFTLLGVAMLRPDLINVVTMLVAFEAVRRASNYAFSRPAREVLYTVVSRQDKYKAKNFIDTFVYRSGDQVGVWSGLALMKLGTEVVAFATLPLAAGWLVLSLLLGRHQRRLAQRKD